MEEIRLRGYAKINPGLDVIQKRDDGYHEVKMVLQSVNIFDELHIAKVSGRESNITLSANMPGIPNDARNLIIKAARLLAKEYEISWNFSISLNKKIPKAAGMAGGSADAAATLVGINRLAGLGLSEERLQKIGLKLGADIPFCIKGGTYLAEGIGEKLTRLPDFPRCSIVVVKPRRGVSTKYVYENLRVETRQKHPDIDRVIGCIERKDLQGIGKNISNILEYVTGKELPVIADLKEKMLELGALGSSMSGSGPSVFGLFDHVEIAKECIRYFREHKKRYELSDVFLTETFDRGVEVLGLQ